VLTFHEYLRARGLCPGRIAAMPERVRVLYLRGYERQMEDGCRVSGIGGRGEFAHGDLVLPVGGERDEG
jgi:hypothetical protein